MPQSVVRPYGLFAALKRSRWRTPGTGPSLPTLDGALFALAGFLALVLFGKFCVDPLMIAHPHQWPQPFAQFLGTLTAFGKADWILLPLAALLLGAIAAGTFAATRADKLIFTSAGLRVFFLIAAIGLPGLIASILKPLAGRVRPFVRGEIDPFVYEPFAYFRELALGIMPFPEYFYGSMPSGHAANVVAAAIAFGALWPMFRPWLWAFAVAIMATRLGIGVHHFTDVLAGAAIGALGALGTRNLFALRRCVFAVDKSGAVRAMPGPGRRRLSGAFRRLFRAAKAGTPTSDPAFARRPGDVMEKCS